MSKLSSLIEAILFVSGVGVELEEIADKLEIRLSEVQDAVQELKASRNDEDGLALITYKNKAQLTTNPKYAEQIALVLNPIRERALTRAALETVAIIAYRQPVTRLDIEQVRGVSSDYAIQLLLTHNLIEVVGRKDAVGKPLLFGVTEEFLKRFEIENLDQLPKYEELLEQIKVLRTERVDSLYDEFEILPLEKGEEIVVESLKGDTGLPEDSEAIS